MDIDGDICGQLEDTRGSLWIFVDIASSLIYMLAQAFSNLNAPKFKFVYLKKSSVFNRSEYRNFYWRPQNLYILFSIRTIKLFESRS